MPKSIDKPIAQLQHRAMTAQVRFDSDVKETRTVTFVASDASVDRHGTVLNPAGWELDNFNANPVIGYMHNVYGSWFGSSDPDDVIGSGRAFTKDDELMVEVKFEPADLNPKADKIFRKVVAGSLRAVSVGFIPVGEGRFGRIDKDGKLHDEDTFFFEGQELLEISIVNIPSNPSALKKAVRSQNLEMLGYLQQVTGLSLGEIESKTLRELFDLMEGKRYTFNPISEPEQKTEPGKKVDENLDLKKNPIFVPNLNAKRQQVLIERRIKLLSK